MFNVIGTVLWSNLFGAFVDLFVQLVLSLALFVSNQALPLTKQLFYRIKKWRIWRQKDSCVSVRLDQVNDFIGLMEAHIIHNKIRTGNAIVLETSEELAQKTRIILRIVGLILNLKKINRIFFHRRTHGIVPPSDRCHRFVSFCSDQ